jgi:chromosome segregation ATPase
LLFKGLSFSKIEKINELVKSINEKDELLESHEDLLVRKHDNFVKLEKALSHEVEKNKILTSELKVCNDSISLLKTDNVDLNNKIEKLNVAHASTSSLEHVSIYTRCKDVDVNVLIKSQNEHIAKLYAKIVEHELENKKFKFAGSMLYNGRRPSI